MKKMLERFYAQLARSRRRLYGRDRRLRRRLTRPVISVGALAVGGSGKTPLAAYVVRVLRDIGERPAVLSRGYGRVNKRDGVVVVHDSKAICCGVDESGDEPMMLAKKLSGVSVLVSEDRYTAGLLAEKKLDASVHVLDDGFQHLSLHRDLDIVLLSERDIDDSRTLPFGRLRENLEVAGIADVIVIETSNDLILENIMSRLESVKVFRLRRLLERPKDARNQLEVTVPDGTPVLAVAGIALPDRFFNALEQDGYSLTETMIFRDHYQLTARDLLKIKQSVRQSGAHYVVTTEKDLVRFLPHAPFDFPLLSIPLEVVVEPKEAFNGWLAENLARFRGVQL